MELKDRIEKEIAQLISELSAKQDEDGAFRFGFESGPMTDANMIILMRILEDQDEALIKALVERLILTQQDNGAWKIYEDSEGHLSATIEAYTALLFSGYVKKSEEFMRKAEHFILSHGGLAKAHTATKFMLAINGLYPWPSFFPFPLFIICLPHWCPLSFYKFSAYVRAHFTSALILGYFRLTIQSRWTPNLSNLLLGTPLSRAKAFLSKAFRPLSRLLSKRFLKKAASQMLTLQGNDETIQGYASATFYFIYALLALGYTKTSIPIKKALEGLKAFIISTDNGFHLQNSPSTVWDTALVTYALHAARTPSTEERELKALHFLLKVKEKLKDVDGWPFYEKDSSRADLDDTQVVLRALSPYLDRSPCYRESFRDGVKWLLNRQNKDGGFSAFEKNKSSTLFTLLPFQNLKDTLTDPSTPDLTGRILEFFGNYTDLTKKDNQIKKAIQWLLDHQEKNGSWYGRWGVSYIYGTWAAVTGLKSVGVSSDHAAMKKALVWLERVQNEDGGWGESCQSDVHRTYCPLTHSTLVQTAWAVDALIALCPHPTPSIKRGLTFLLMRTHLPQTAKNYPSGAGLPGQFYIYYHSYPIIWPLLALCHYKENYLN